MRILGVARGGAAKASTWPPRRASQPRDPPPPPIDWAATEAGELLHHVTVERDTLRMLTGLCRAGW